MTQFPSVYDENTDRFEARFWEALQQATPFEIRRFVQDACSYIDVLVTSDPDVTRRKLNATSAINRCVANLLMKIQEKPVELKEEVAADEAGLKEFLITYTLPHGIEIIDVVTDADVGSVNFRWKRQYADGDWIMVKEYDGGIQVFRARDVLAVKITER